MAPYKFFDLLVDAIEVNNASVNLEKPILGGGTNPDVFLTVPCFKLAFYVLLRVSI